MKFGAVYPQTEYGHDPAAIRDYAQTVEELGYTHVIAYDHVLGANPDRPGGWKGTYTYESAFQEPLMLFSYMAGLTRKIGFLTGVIILPQRQTALFAKQAAILDIYCEGRLRLGIGLGWNAVEYTALNQDFHTRGRRIEEQVQVLRRLWTEPLVTFEGRWHTIPDAGLNPLPVQRPIPIWFGGHADPVLERVAKIGDGWLPNFRDPADALPVLEKLDRYLAEANRDRSRIGLEARLLYGEGKPEVWGKTVESWQSAGFDRIGVNTMGSGFQTPSEHLNALRTFAETVKINQ